VQGSYGTDDRWSVAIDGREIDLAARDGDALRAVERRIEMRCLSGTPITGTWRGPPTLDLFSAVGHTDQATHVVAEAADGHGVSLPVADLVDGVLATERLDSPAADTDPARRRLPRLVAPGLEGPRAVKNVVAIDLTTLPPEREPTELDGIGSELPPRVAPEMEGSDE
jgi:DMSO/TMAO reductase YedYZ molybdopterin-dependent catalytic subunit